MSTTDLPTPSTSTLALSTPPRKRLIDRMPVLSHLRQSVGLQRGMLITGLVITIGFLLIAILAPLIAPYSWAQQSVDGVAFGTQQAPNATNILGTTVSGFDVGVAKMPMNTAFNPSNTEDESALSGPSSMVEMSSSLTSASPRVRTTSLPKAAGLSSDVCALIDV